MNDELKQFSIPTNMEIIDNFSNDDRFTHIKLSLCTHQQYKANGMHFGKELLERKQEQIDFMPIFGLMKIVENDDGTVSYEMGDHETVLEYENGKLQYKSKTVILGVALPNTRKFEEITRNDVTKEYLTFEALLYSKKYPQLKTLTTSKLNASMEISKVTRHYDEEMDRYEIDDFCLDAHCLLGENVLPAFHEAGILEVFSMDSFKDEYHQIMEEIKFSLNNIGKGDVTVEDNKEIMEQENEDLSTSEELDSQEENKDNDKEITNGKTDDEELADENSNVNIEDSGEKLLTKEEVDKLKEDKQKLEEKYGELATKFTELENEARVLRQFKEEKDTEEYKAKLESEKEAKKILIESFASKLTDDEIKIVVTDVEAQTYEEIKTGLSIAFADKELVKNKDTESQTFANIGSNKPLDTKAKLLAEMKARKNNKKIK